MAFDEPLEFGLDETWTIEGALWSPDGTPIDPEAVDEVWVRFSVIGGGAVLDVAATQVATEGAGDDAYTRALFDVAPADRRDDDDNRLFARRVYDYRVWVELNDGTVHDQNAGHLTVT